MRKEPVSYTHLDVYKRQAIEGVDSIGSYLETTAYADAVEELRRSPSAFERWCDNLLIRKIKPQQYSAFGLGPLAAYILARENEIKSVPVSYTHLDVYKRQSETYPDDHPDHGCVHGAHGPCSGRQRFHHTGPCPC